MSQNGSVGRQISSQSAGDVIQRAVSWIFFSRLSQVGIWPSFLIR